MTVTLDVRPILARGEEPLATILDAAERLPAGESLRLIAPFEPRPLYQVLGARGFRHEVIRRESEAVEVVFTRAAAAPQNPHAAP